MLKYFSQASQSLMLGRFTSSPEKIYNTTTTTTLKRYATTAHTKINHAIKHSEPNSPDRHTHRETETETHTHKEVGRQTERQKETETDRHKHK